MAVQKKRHWAFVLYPDSAPDDWRDKLRLYGVPCAISPLHNQDKTKDGADKKPHYHIILSYPSPTTLNNVKEFVGSLGQNKYAEAIQNLLAYYRYLAHLDDPEKAQYDPEDITIIGNFKVPREKMDSDDCVLGLFAFIRDNQIVDYARLIDILSQAEELDMLQYAVCHAYSVIAYLNSSSPRKNSPL